MDHRHLPPSRTHAHSTSAPGIAPFPSGARGWEGPQHAPAGVGWCPTVERGPAGPLSSDWRPLTDHDGAGTPCGSDNQFQKHYSPARCGCLSLCTVIFN